jgi:hypothetical protein
MVRECYSWRVVLVIARDFAHWFVRHRKNFCQTKFFIGVVRVDEFYVPQHSDFLAKVFYSVDGKVMEYSRALSTVSNR